MNIIAVAFAMPIILLASTNADIKRDKIKQPASFQTVTVKQIIDGDTFISTDNQHIRIWGINSPEKDEAGYWQAVMFLDLKIRYVELKCRLIDKDKYKRSVMQCNKSGIDIGSYMVQTGYARDFVKYSKGFYKVDEHDAQKAQRGMWNPENEINPDLKYTPY